jgi:hypothetical protein
MTGTIESHMKMATALGFSIIQLYEKALGRDHSKKRSRKI